MEYFLRDIVEYTGNPDTARLVSTDWNDAISRNNVEILESLKRKYPNQKTIQGRVAEAVRRRDINTIRTLLNSYTGYIRWDIPAYIADMDIIEMIYSGGLVQPTYIRRWIEYPKSWGWARSSKYIPLGLFDLVFKPFTSEDITDEQINGIKESIKEQVDWDKVASRVTEFIIQNPNANLLGLAFAFKNGWIELLDGRISKNNIISIISLQPVGPVNKRSQFLLEKYDIDPSVFSLLLEGNNVSPSIWRIVLANAIHYNNLALVKMLVTQYKSSITTDMYRKMISLSRTEEMKDLVSSI